MTPLCFVQGDEREPIDILTSPQLWPGPMQGLVAAVWVPILLKKETPQERAAA